MGWGWRVLPAGQETALVFKRKVSRPVIWRQSAGESQITNVNGSFSPSKQPSLYIFTWFHLKGKKGPGSSRCEGKTKRPWFAPGYTPFPPTPHCGQRTSVTPSEGLHQASVTTVQSTFDLVLEGMPNLTGAPFRQRQAFILWGLDWRGTEGQLSFLILPAQLQMTSPLRLTHRMAYLGLQLSMWERRWCGVD